VMLESSNATRTRRQANSGRRWQNTLKFLLEPRTAEQRGIAAFYTQSWSTLPHATPLYGSTSILPSGIYPRIELVRLECGKQPVSLMNRSPSHWKNSRGRRSSSHRNQPSELLKERQHYNEHL
jgi:hypothetical protein